MSQWFKKITSTWVGKFITHTMDRYFNHTVAHEAAALAYYLLFMLFPLMIFFSSLLGLLELDVSGIIKSLSHLLPGGVLDVLESYLTYVSQTSSRNMLWFGLVFTIYFPMRAADCLMSSVRKAYHLPKPKNQIFHTAKVLLYTVFLLVSIALALTLSTVGRKVLEFASRFMVVPEAFIELWSGLRFLVLGGVMFAAIGLLYAAAQDVRQPVRNILPGTALALAAWMIVSAAFSFYVENFGSYSVIYGALGTVIVLMMWLNLTAVSLIMGAEVNGVLMALRGERARRPWRKQKKKETGTAPEPPASVEEKSV